MTTAAGADAAATDRAFRDSSVDCAICLSPLDDAETVELSCGHRWHLDCIREQLRHAQPDRSRRVLFSGCRCAKCGTFCDHEALEHLTRRTDALRNRVDALVAEQLSVDAADVWRNTTSAEERSRLVDEGRRTYAFYLCGSCDGPYFGGTADCAEQDEGELVSGEERLCPACSPRSQLVCADPVRHRGHHVWKCRYCCSSATHVCYGTVHFCDDCHDRNGRRVKEQQRQQQRGWRGTGGAVPAPLEPVPCVGDECPFPKPEGQRRHENGASCRCEQVYYCAWCRSTPPSRSGISQEPPGSRNFVYNPSGEHGLRGWRQLNPHTSWVVEQSEVPPDEVTRSNFVSSFQWCVMAQNVPLHRFVRDPASVRVEVSAKFMARTDCPSVFRMEAILLDSRGREICRKNTAPLVAPADFWERTSLVIEPTRRAHDAVMIIYGKDGRFWQGQFGSKVAECSVRVLCEEDQLEQVLIQELVDGGQRYQMRVPVENRIREGPRDWVRNHRFDILLPFALLLFAWFMSE